VAERVLEPEERLSHALGVAYGHLSKRDRTVREVERHLEGKGIDDETASAAIAELIEQRYLDDARYARLFAEDRRALDGWGSERIERRLREVGIPADVIAGVIGGGEDHDELAAALAVLEQRLAAPPADERERTKALGLLVRRGYELEVAYDAVRAFERA
jgi:regulatory protein